jgi:hypothetical protein
MSKRKRTPKNPSHHAVFNRTFINALYTLQFKHDYALDLNVAASTSPWKLLSDYSAYLKKHPGLQGVIAMFDLQNEVVQKHILNNEYMIMVTVRDYSDENHQKVIKQQIVTLLREMGVEVFFEQDCINVGISSFD